MGLTQLIATSVVGALAVGLIYGIFVFIRGSVDSHKSDKEYPKFLSQHGCSHVIIVSLDKADKVPPQFVDENAYLMFYPDSMKLMGYETKNILELPYASFSSFAVKYKKDDVPKDSSKPSMKFLQRLQQILLYSEKEPEQNPFVLNVADLSSFKSFNLTAHLRNNAISLLSEKLPEQRGKVIPFDLK
jgi:hypothetical protein